MDFSWSAQQQENYDRVIVFTREHLSHDVRERERLHLFRIEDWRKCGDFGLLGLCAPTCWGGLGLSALDSAYSIEAFGRGCPDMGLVFSAAAHLFACVHPISVYATTELRDRVLLGLCNGSSIGANAITEPEAGSDVFALRTTARRDGGTYVLQGSKNYVTNAPVADKFLVYAMTDVTAGYLGVSAFVVDRQSAGLRVGQPFEKMGLSSSPIAPIYFDEVHVPVENRVGDEGEGAAIFSASMHWERACLFAGYIGAMDRQLDQVLEYAKSRRQFRRSIGKHQALAHRIVDMKHRLESCRLLLYRACWLLDQGRDATAAISMAKLAVSEAAVASAIDAIHVHGGIGYMKEAGIESALRDAIPATIFSGTSEIQKDLIAKHLGL